MPKPQSLGRRSRAFLYRKLSREWHPTNNGELTLKQVSLGSSRKVWWLCDEGHEWQALAQTSLEALHPDVAIQWHPAKHDKLTLEQVRPGAQRKVWWICGEGRDEYDRAGRLLRFLMLMGRRFSPDAARAAARDVAGLSHIQ